jgi:hypothetical protein
VNTLQDVFQELEMDPTARQTKRIERNLERNREFAIDAIETAMKRLERTLVELRSEDANEWIREACSFGNGLGASGPAHSQIDKALGYCIRIAGMIEAIA